MDVLDYLIPSRKRLERVRPRTQFVLLGLANNPITEPFNTGSVRYYIEMITFCGRLQNTVSVTIGGVPTISGINPNNGSSCSFMSLPVAMIFDAGVDVAVQVDAGVRVFDSRRNIIFEGWIIN